MRCRHRLCTPSGAGGIAIFRVEGAGAAAVIRRVAGRAADAAAGAILHTNLAGVDDGLAVRVAEEGWRLMPHGGPAIVRAVGAALEAAGSTLAASRPRGIDAAVAEAAARAASPAAVDALARQPALWRAAVGRPLATAGDLLGRSDVLDRLVDPPRLVVAGRPNAGKSTLLNRVAGEAAAAVSPSPGTTRDWVGRRVALVPAGGDPLADAVVVDWCDTPGLRAAGGAERRAIELAAAVLADADLLVELVAPEEARLTRDELPREPDVVVGSKSDLSGSPEAGGGLRLSAATGEGIDAFVAEVVERLFPEPPRRKLWAFDPLLRARVEGHPTRPPRGWLGGRRGATDRSVLVW
ncbi:GTPase [Phycisphaera mikurensis]|uniref:Putative GTPase n=1 Tax=Phycisphaera mikurensis (strain NBRC 102666 / KCTC 22515 / FYK2301M01) TaxID=1142394 RepID=I0IDK1_PHYMF|nr:GTPase [Phycisphaera mikurensis]MBB6441159.1 tRNA modification GTPase [Phycisphaera mikurensis]BAM03339.1 putative GTPase [Phycisphaera mikurensis NBRC 102666]